MSSQFNPSHLQQSPTLERCFYDRKYGFFLTRRKYDTSAKNCLLLVQLQALVPIPNTLHHVQHPKKIEKEPIISSLNYAKQLFWMIHHWPDAEPHAVLKEAEAAGHEGQWGTAKRWEAGREGTCTRVHHARMLTRHKNELQTNSSDVLYHSEAWTPPVSENK